MGGGYLLKKPAFAILFVILLLGILMVCSVKYERSTVALAEGNLQPLAYVPINITNRQSIATPNPFQVMIQVDSTKNATYEAADLSNIAFTYPNGTVIPSWLASGNSNSSTYTIYWLKVGSIPATSSMTINMTFYPTTDNVLNNETTGEAPALSSSYGQYDDGANVFIVYADFLKGLNNWRPYSFSGSLVPIPTLKGVELISNGGESTYLVSPITLPAIPIQIEEGWDLSDGRNFAQAISAFGSPPFGTSSLVPANVQGNGPAPLILTNSISVVFNENWGNHAWLEESLTNSIVNASENPGPGSIISFLTVNGTWASAGYATTSLDISGFNTPIPTTMSGNIPNPFNNNGLIISGVGGYSDQEYVRWLVASAFPPNGVAPNVTLGNLTVIPEFPSIIIVPAFMMATLLAVIVYRRKGVKTSQNQT